MNILSLYCEGELGAISKNSSLINRVILSCHLHITFFLPWLGYLLFLFFNWLLFNFLEKDYTLVVFFNRLLLLLFLNWAIFFYSESLLSRHALTYGDLNARNPTLVHLMWGRWANSISLHGDLTHVQVTSHILRECLLTRLPRLKCIRLGSVPSSHFPLKMPLVGYVRRSLPILMHVGSIATPFV